MSSAIDALSKRGGINTVFAMIFLDGSSEHFDFGADAMLADAEVRNPLMLSVVALAASVNSASVAFPLEHRTVGPERL